jgi:hypothetical protein
MEMRRMDPKVSNRAERTREDSHQKPLPLKTILGLFLGFGLGALLFSPWRKDPTSRLPEVGAITQVMAGLQGLPQKRAEGELRVFVFGASMSFGLPYQPEGMASWARVLEQGLREVLPGKPITVRPIAQPAVDATQLSKVVSFMLGWNATHVLFVLGQNEFLNRVAHGEELVPQGVPARIGLALSDGGRGLFEDLLGREFLRGTGMESQAPSGFFQSLRKARPGRPAIGGLPVRAPDRFLLVERSRRALERVRKACSQKGVPLVVCLAPQAVDGFPPWLSRMGPPSKDHSYGPAKASFVAGRRARHAGKAAEAHKAFWNALDLDLAPLHQTSNLRRMIFSWGQKKGVPLLDLSEPLRAKDGIAGPSLFLDNAHVDLEGHRRIASFVAKRLQNNWWPKLPEHWKDPFMERAKAWHRDMVTPRSQKTARAHLAKNVGRWMLVFGNFEDALPFLQDAVQALPLRKDLQADFSFCKKELEKWR